MNRRQLIGSTLEIAAALGVLGISTPALAHSSGRPALTLYDPRFAQASGATEALARGSSISAVGSDVTELAPLLLQDASAHDPLLITGVTTESVPFCLQQLARSAGVATLDMRRLDQDLFIWKLTVNCK